MCEVENTKFSIQSPSDWMPWIDPERFLSMIDNLRLFVDTRQKLDDLPDYQPNS